MYSVKSHLSPIWYRNTVGIRGKIKFRQYTKKERVPNNKIISCRDLIEFFGANYSKKNCHIIGSGGAAVNSVDKIDSNDMVININFSGLLVDRCDIYLTELCSSESEEKANRSFILSKIINNTNCTYPPLFKNIWLGNVHWLHVKNLYNSDCRLIRDFYYSKNKKRAQSEKDFYNEMIEYVYDEKHFLVQWGPSVYAATRLAAQMGFQEIIWHGADFGGGHFYDDQQFLWPSYITREDKSFLLNRKSREASIYFYENSASLVKYLFYFLKKNRINLYSASKDVKGDSLLPSWEKGQSSQG